MVMSMAVTLGAAAAGASRFLIGLVTCLPTHGGIPAVARLLTPIGAGRHDDRLRGGSAGHLRDRATSQRTSGRALTRLAGARCHRLRSRPLSSCRSPTGRPAWHVRGPYFPARSLRLGSDVWVVAPA